MEYSLCDIREDMLEATMERIIKDDRIIGFNVTIPFKEQIRRFLTELDRTAENAGAVNLVVVSAGRRKLTGYNTDIDGVIASLSKLGVIDHSGHSAVILGAGGAARGCICALLASGFDEITVLNRSEKRAVEVASYFQELYPRKRIRAAPLDSSDLESAFSKASILINTIPLNAKLPFVPDFSKAPKSTKFLDLNYRKNAPLLGLAKKEGIASIDGSLMLVEQAARSFEILTGISAPRKIMMLVVKKQMAEE